MADGEDRQLPAVRVRPSRARQTLRKLDIAAMVENDPPAVPWVIEDLAIAGYLTMLSGKEGTGKSLLSMSLAAGVALGEQIAGMECGRRRVLVVDAENGDYEIHRRVHSLGLPREGVELMVAEGFHVGRELEALERAIQESEARLVILDSFRTLWPGGDENDTAAVTAVLDPLAAMFRRRKAAGLLLHHVARSANDYRGSSAIGASVHLGFVLSRHPEDPENHDRRRLSCWKCRPAPEPDDRWLRLHVERGQVYVDRTDPYEGDSRTEQAGRPVRNQLAPQMLAAAAQPIIWADLARAIDRDPKDGTARRVRDGLLASEELIRLEDGRCQAAEGAIEGGTLLNRISKPNSAGVPECQTPRGQGGDGTPAEEAA